MKVLRPLDVIVPSRGLLFAQSVHGAGFQMEPRADAFHKLVYVLDGRIGYRADEGAWLRGLGKGALLAIPAGRRHVIADETPSTLLLLCVGRGFASGEAELAELWAAVVSTGGRVLLPPRPARLRLEAWWRAALAETAHARPGRAVALRAITAQVLVMLARMPEPRAGDTAAGRVAAVVREVDETFFEEWDLDRAAARAALSRRRFSALYRATTGRGFGEHLTERRLAHAATLLQAGAQTIVGVMFSCGFNDLSHFYRMFRARHGVPPREWAERERARPR